MRQAVYDKRRDVDKGLLAILISHASRARAKIPPLFLLA